MIMNDTKMAYKNPLAWLQYDNILEAEQVAIQIDDDIIEPGISLIVGDENDSGNMTFEIVLTLSEIRKILRLLEDDAY